MMLLDRLTHLVSCREASRLLSRREDARLGAGERIKLALHVRACVACSRFAEHLAFIREALRRYRA
jgi:hypothetical protein